MERSTTKAKHTSSGLYLGPNRKHIYHCSELITTWASKWLQHWLMSRPKISLQSITALQRHSDVKRQKTYILNKHLNLVPNTPNFKSRGSCRLMSDYGTVCVNSYYQLDFVNAKLKSAFFSWFSGSSKLLTKKLIFMLITVSIGFHLQTDPILLIIPPQGTHCTYQKCQNHGSLIFSF